MQCQAINWSDADLLAVFRTNFCEICIKIQTFLLRTINLKMLSSWWQPFCYQLNVFKRQSHHSSRLAYMGTICNFEGTVQITGWYLIKCVYWHSNQNKNITSFHLGEHLMLNDWCPRTILIKKKKKKNSLNKLPWTSFTWDLHIILRIISRSVPGIATVFGAVHF